MSAPAPGPGGTKGWRAPLLRFDDSERLERIDDALLLVRNGHVLAVGAYGAVAPLHPGAEIVDLRPWTLAPGFIDLHVHASQIDVIGAASEGLLDWLERRTFPAEAAFSSIEHARSASSVFLDALVAHGVTSALIFGSPHPQAIDALFEAARPRGLRLIAGHALMDRNGPPDLCVATEVALAAAEAVVRRWHGVDRLGVALSPRFAPSCTPALLEGVGALLTAHPDLWLQTHASETRDEQAWVARLFPQARNDLEVYDRCGLLGERSVFAHCLQVDDRDRARLRESGSAVAVCPTSNLFLGSGLFDFAAAERFGLTWGLASDVGAGTSLSPFRTMLAAFQVARLGGVTLSPALLWHRHTIGAARALRLAGHIGNLAPGCEADFIAIDPAATPLLARRTAAADTLDAWLMALITLADDRAIRQTFVLGEPVCAVSNRIPRPP